MTSSGKNEQVEAKKNRKSSEEDPNNFMQHWKLKVKPPRPQKKTGVEGHNSSNDKNENDQVYDTDKGNSGGRAVEDTRGNPIGLRMRNSGEESSTTARSVVEEKRSVDVIEASLSPTSTVVLEGQEQDADGRQVKEMVHHWKYVGKKTRKGKRGALFFDADGETHRRRRGRRKNSELQQQEAPGLTSEAIVHATSALLGPEAAFKNYYEEKGKNSKWSRNRNGIATVKAPKRPQGEISIQALSSSSSNRVSQKRVTSTTEKDKNLANQRPVAQSEEQHAMKATHQFSQRIPKPSSDSEETSRGNYP
eukprot:Nk52_evm28s311 gene=Nk52_evmTU28s311